MKHTANSSQAAWALIMEGVTSARLNAHRLQKLLSMGQTLVEKSTAKDHIYQVAGDLIVGAPGQLERLIVDLDRTAYALAKIGEAHLQDRLPIHDRALVEDGIENSPFGRARSVNSAARVARKWKARQES